jgi:hypothetical protein
MKSLFVMLEQARRRKLKSMELLRKLLSKTSY